MNSDLLPQTAVSNGSDRTLLVGHFVLFPSSAAVSVRFSLQAGPHTPPAHLFYGVFEFIVNKALKYLQP